MRKLYSPPETAKATMASLFFEPDGLLQASDFGFSEMTELSYFDVEL
jgi:hypothetical protein